MGKAPFWLTLGLLLLGLNVVFAVFQFASYLVAPQTIANRIQVAFAADDLVTEDYLRFDTYRGFHQYNDCVILQMLSNADAVPAGRALAPLVYFPPSDDVGMCQTLRQLVVENQPTDQLNAARYTRYWHGYMPIIGLLLSFLSVAQTRFLLRALVYLAVLFLLFSAVRLRGMFPLTIPIGAVGLVFWGLPSFGLGMSHALGDAVVMLGLGSLIFWHQTLLPPRRLILYCAVFGGAVIYFEMLTGPLPIAAGLLFPTVYCLSRLTHPQPNNARYHGMLATAALFAFVLGAVFTFGDRVVVLMLVHPDSINAFLQNLELYTGSAGTFAISSVLLERFQPLLALMRRGEVLTYCSTWAMYGLYLATGLAWVVSALLAFRHANRVLRLDWLVFVTGAMSVPLWSLILPTHTIIHADFMARILLVPIALGWAALFWQVYQRRPTTVAPEIA